MDTGSTEQAGDARRPFPRRASPLMRVGIVLFGVGVLAVVAVFALFAAGLENLPVWLSVAAGVITPLGLALGLVALVRDARRSPS